MNKKIWELNNKIIIIGIAVILVILASIITLVAFYGNDNESKITDVYKQTIVNDLTFENAEIKEENGLYLYKVDVINNSKKDYKLNYITFEFYDENDKQIATLVGYAKDELKSKEKFTINTNIDVDIRNAKKVKFIINR